MPKTRGKILQNFLNKPWRFRGFFSALLVLILIFPAAAATVSAQEMPDKETILSGIEKKYSGKDFSADYHQQSILKAIDISEDAFGKAYFSHPGKMRWEYNKTENHQIITNGKTLWIYRPDENQVVQGSAVEFFKAGAGGAFLSDISLVRKSYSISIEKADAAFVDLILTPTKKNSDISSIRIRVGRGSYEIKSVVTYNSYGDTTELAFSNIKFQPLDASLFEFTIPKGTDLFHMNQQ